jgi:phosphate butyryltransferase
MDFITLKEKIINAKANANIAVVQPESPEVFEAIKSASMENLCHFSLIGDQKTILMQMEKVGLKGCEIINAADATCAAYSAIDLIHRKQAHILMKGNVPTDVLLKAVLDHEKGLRTTQLLSHLVIVETHERAFLGVTDGGINIQPTLADKVSIIHNAVKFFHRLGVEKPKVALLSATEKPNPKIPSAAQANQLIDLVKAANINDCLVYGPVAFDLAISRRARQIKKVDNKIYSNADIVLVPEIVCGNSLAKSLIYCAKFHSGGVVLGAECPIILLSRADSAQEKLNSIILGVMQCIRC